MSLRTLRIKDEEDMRVLAVRLAQILKMGDVLALRGDLGAGKTSFTRSLVNALAPSEEEVPSPTFTLVQVYERQKPAIWHFDLYRIEEEQDILELGWEDAIRFGVTVVEWPERLGSLMPKDRLEIDIQFVPDSENERDVSFVPHGRWVTRRMTDE
ncbi:MAG: tRNA (adenosine(37)-N6)-threonylcarbamoyltransferase complex ATPase subunit type 1 TsaE [Alphaproteobacteria bacterium]|nr:tRNA (adenosine(37)-N6)-threonylcarbamoyltransferase complex ATPase subunit type 1 TsaE [Alphaproteobacteria bacterium]